MESHSILCSMECSVDNLELDILIMWNRYLWDTEVGPASIRRGVIILGRGDRIFIDPSLLKVEISSDVVYDLEINKMT